MQLWIWNKDQRETNEKKKSLLKVISEDLQKDRLLVKVGFFLLLSGY